MNYEATMIDAEQLIHDLQLNEERLLQIASLGIDNAPGVTSKSALKLASLENALRIVCSGQEFTAYGETANSKVGEQPLGGDTIDGAMHRLTDAISRHGDGTWFSVENGLFRVAEERPPAIPCLITKSLLRFPEDADLTKMYDPTAEYEDRAVAVIRLPDFPVVVQVSPSSEAVRFPREAVRETVALPGGFIRNTVGSLLESKGIVGDKQNPHIDLTKDRPGGPLSRQDQIARTVIRGLLRLVRY